MYFAGFIGVPEHFSALTEKHILFLQKYNLHDIKIVRNNKELELSAHELQPEDHIIELGRLEKYLKIVDEARTKNYFSIFGFDKIKILEEVTEETEEKSEVKTTISSVPSAQKAKNQNIQGRLHNLQDSIVTSEKLQEEGQEILQDLFKSGNFQNFKLDGIEEIAKGIDSTLSENPVSYNALTLLKDHDEYTFRHCIDVANQMMMVLKYMERDKTVNMKEVGVAALLHDVGKSKIPQDIINKPGKLTDKEWEYMRMHPVYSAEIMRDLGLTNMQIGIGYKHHVKKNGTGYPKGVSYEETSEIDRLSTISDVYQALITKRPYKMTDTPIQAFKKLKQWMGTDFDERLVEIFIKAFGIFPPGSMVKLTDGRCAFVLIRGKDTLRPVVAVVIDKDRSRIQTPEIIDLEHSDYAELRILEGTNHQNEITVIEARDWLKNRTTGIIAIDLRDTDLFDEHHIEDFTNIPLEELTVELPRLNQKKTMLLLCEDGKKSRKAHEILKACSLKSLVIRGGLSYWEKVIDPAVKRNYPETEKQ
ncbi:hypothetical protein CHS0354_006952 [Potamilus streckersoni]|uniref:HD-GYP domain-containing protein n=1 Tax=Potamilus streckersoni TaxID=2493646 RepID=A0AAE0WBW0_9BIVA|nr:hypothetical protein CHS0354_006952 [Potamilus streckersoni]